MSASRAEERAAATSITISPSIGEELGRHWQRERMVEYLQRRDGFALERFYFSETAETSPGCVLLRGDFGGETPNDGVGGGRHAAAVVWVRGSAFVLQFFWLW